MLPVKIQRQTIKVRHVLIAQSFLVTVAFFLTYTVLYIYIYIYIYICKCMLSLSASCKHWVQVSSRASEFVQVTPIHTT